MSTSPTKEESVYNLNKTYSLVGEKNVWVEFTGLARDYNAVNLGQGFPNYQSYEILPSMIEKSLKQENSMLHQYTRSSGHLRLVNGIAKCYGQFLNRKIDPFTEVLVTCGAYGSLFNSLKGFIEKGDEIIIIEPFFDCYAPMSIISGAKCVYIPLRPRIETPISSADWIWNVDELEAAFSSKTKLIIINTPNNPCKVFTEEELKKIADLCIRNNTICIADEVYEHITYERPHFRIASLPGMWERTVTIGSAGKAFSSTGVKLGWTIGPKELIRLCQVVHANSIYTCPTFFQDVIGYCFELEASKLGTKDSYFNTISNELKPKRDRLAKLLVEAGLMPIVPEGGYFMLADISKLSSNFKSDSNEYKDSKFVKYLIKDKGLATIPATVFYSDANKSIGENYIRFCFFKDESTLEKASDILKKFKI